MIGNASKTTHLHLPVIWEYRNMVKTNIDGAITNKKL